MLLFLLLVGYGAMARVFSRQRQPIRDMGLVLRSGWQREFGLGAALGWGMLVASILPMVLIGGLIVTFWLVPRQFGILLIDLLLLAVASLAEEVAFRGYPFQRLIEAMGPTLATLVFSLAFAGAHILNPGSNRASFLITVFSSWLLSVAYLRTRALWVCWGWHFAWNASMCLLFGLPVSGITEFSPVIQSNTVGPPWITGRRLWSGSQRGDCRRAAYRDLHRLPDDPRVCVPLHPTGHYPRRHPRRPGRNEPHPRSASPCCSSACAGREPRWSRSTLSSPSQAPPLPVSSALPHAGPEPEDPP